MVPLKFSVSLSVLEFLAFTNFQRVPCWFLLMVISILVLLAYIMISFTPTDFFNRANRNKVHFMESIFFNKVSLSARNFLLILSQFL